MVPTITPQLAPTAAFACYGWRSVAPRVFLRPRIDVSIDDACYLAVAELLDTRLLTADERLSFPVRSHTDVNLLL